jgi:hypothetical protein
MEDNFTLTLNTSTSEALHFILPQSYYMINGELAAK